MTPEELRAKGFVEGPSGYWTKPKNLGAGAARTGENPIVGTVHPAQQHGAPARTFKRLRQSSKPLLNKLETEWYHVLKSTYPPACPVFSQAMRFRLGNGIWYKPDFIVWGSHVYAYEVKGPHAFRGGFENLKVAANLYREVKWFLVWKQDGKWQEQEILP